MKAEKLTTKQLNDLLKAASRETIEYSYLRFGQSMFNLLYESYPDLANEVRGTELDPFYAETESDTFTMFIEYILGVDCEEEKD